MLTIEFLGYPILTHVGRGGQNHHMRPVAQVQETNGNEKLPTVRIWVQLSYLLISNSTGERPKAPLFLRLSVL